MQTRKEIDRGDIKLAIDMLSDIDDPATEHILGVFVDCGNEIAKLRAENEALKERERTNDTLLIEQGDKLAALNDELTELRAFKAACEGRRDMAVEAVIEQCMLVESCWVEGDIRKTLKNLCDYWFSAGMDEQQSVLETALVLDLRQQIAVLQEQLDLNTPLAALEGLQQEVATLTEQRDLAVEALNAVKAVMNHSEGIAGWYLNGNVATWYEVLPEVDDALAVIKSTEMKK